MSPSSDLAIVMSPSSDLAILSSTESRLGGIQVQGCAFVMGQQLPRESRGRGMNASLRLMRTGGSV